MANSAITPTMGLISNAGIRGFGQWTSCCRRKTRKEAAYEAQSSYVQTKMAEHKESPLYDIQVAEFVQLKMEKEAVVS